MLISLHKQATTTPRIRAAIQASTDPAWMVAERYGISEQTVWKWRGRDDVHDRSHTPHRLQTTLTQEAVAVALRKALLLPLDDLLAVVREFLTLHVSRSGLDCIDPMKTCSCYTGERSNEYDDGRQHQALDGEAEDGSGDRDHPGETPVLQESSETRR